MPKAIPLAIFIQFICFCITAQTTTVTYQVSNNDFANPERGFYRYSSTRSSNYTLLNQSVLESYRLLHTPPTANYSIYSTLVFRYFYLEDFKNANISQAYLDNMQADFNTARSAGVKLIPRFAYTDDIDGSSCSSWICPPYGDAPKNWVLTHINQLQPVLEANKDVIAAVQMGFIGVWGENYYTDYFGDASQAPDYKLLDSNWTDRIDVLNELLNAVPAERMVQVRYPQMKQRTVYGINAPTNSNALIISEAFSGTNKSRIGFHNDCFLASQDDFGTYTNYGNSSSVSMSDTLNLKPYLANDSKFVIVGGETCSDNYNPQNNCSNTDPSASGDSEIERMHFSYLNSQYNNDVNNDWVADGCMNEIKKRLGYRFELQNGTFSNSTQANQVIDVQLNLLNTGYASPYNQRGVELMFRNTASSEIWFVALDDDPRFWFPGNSNHNISETICIPGQIPTGTYEVLLHLPDPMPSLHGIPEYSIRLANLLPDGSDVWENTTGYNKLGHFIEIDNISNNSPCNGEITLSELSPDLPVELINFQATPENDKIKLAWTTISEINNQGFYLERSDNNQDFSKIKWIDGKGNSNISSHYSYTDSEVKNGTDYYYRLMQLDYDGTKTYSNIVTAKIDDKDFNNSIRLFPNPTHDVLRIDYGINNQIDVELNINIINITGTVVYSEKTNNRNLDLSSLPKGMYFLEINIGQEKIVRKFFKE